MKEVVTIGMNHVCPMTTGMTPHVGGPIIGPGCRGVRINDVPVSVLGDTCVCVGAIDMIVEGCPGVRVNGVPIVVQGCMTAHGGTIPAGVSGVKITSATPAPMRHKPLKKNEFLTHSCGEDITEETDVGQEELLQEASEQEPVLYNIRWIRNEEYINSCTETEKVKVVASVIGINDGENVDFEVVHKFRPDQSEKVYHLSGTVSDGEVEVELEVEKSEEIHEPEL